MRNFVQHTKLTQRTTPEKSVVLKRTRFGPAPEVNSTRQLPRTIGSQAVLRLPQAHAEEFKADAALAASTRFAHDFSRIPLHSPSAGVIQTKLAINKPADEYEQEADRVAERIMRMPEPQLQRACVCGGERPKCQTNQLPKESKKLQTKRVQDSDTHQGAAPPIVYDVLQFSGQPLQAATRAFMEPRFGHDFSQVRAHYGPIAAESATQINARAYTVGHNVVFGAGEYAPGTPHGLGLIAHELAHVIQQGSSNHTANTIQRTVAATSSCPAGTHNAPADPLAALRDVDSMAQDMALSDSHLLFIESLTFNDPTFGRSSVFDAYQNNFGTPVQTSTGAWRSRFRTATFATEEEAMAHEMQVLSNRFKRIHNWLAGNIHYRCPGTASFTIPGCAAGPCGTSTAQTCPTGSRTIAICPNFWTWAAPRDRGQASDLIHEAIHPLFHFGAHSTANVVGRGRNPGCYAGFVLDVFDTGLRPNDCPAI